MDINICLVCPSDVRLEETAAQSVINRLRDQYAQEATINCTLAHQHESASTTAEQNGFPNASFDVLIAVLWTTAEHDFLRALPQNVSSMPKKCLIYRRHSLIDSDNLSVIDQERLNAQLLKLEDFCTQLQSHSDSPPYRWRTFEDPTRFPELLEKDLQSLIEERIFGELPPAGSWSGTPFPGLSAYSIQHALVYCGREAAVEKTFRLLMDRASMNNPSILIAGASGSGKSSLARCGLANRLAKKFLNVPQIEMRPGAGDSEPPARIFAKLLEDAIPETAGFRMEQILQDNPSAAINILEGIQSRHKISAGTPYLILILDQLEELTSPQADGNAVQCFTTALNLLVRRGLCWCIATIRSDKIGTLAEVPDLSFLLESSGLHFLEPPTPAEIGLMIRRPARLAGLAYERHAGSAQSLDELIQQEATEKPNILPLLQFTLSQIYETRTETGVLRFEDYRRMGGIPGCVAAHAEAVFTVLPETVQATFNTVFRELVTVAADSESPSRQWLQPGTFSGDANAMALIDALVDGRLLVRDQQGTHGAVEIVHESLLRDWPRLAEWLQKETEILRKRSRALQSYKRWINGGKRKDLLLPSGTALDEAVDVQQNGLLVAEKDAQEPEIAEYLQESRRHAAFRSRARKFAITSLSLLTLVSIILALATRKALDSATQLNADFLKQKDVAEAAASNAVKAQLNSLDLSLDSVQGTLKELEQLAANELNNDHSIKSLQYLHEAEKIAAEKPKKLLESIQSAVTRNQSNPSLWQDIQPVVEAIRERLLGSRTLDASHWRHRQAILFREFPEITWRRRLQANVLRATLSPDRRLLLLLIESGTEQLVLVWNLQENKPTECQIKLPLSQSFPLLAWASDGLSFILLREINNSDDNPVANLVSRFDPLSGKTLAGPIRHPGIISTAAASADGRYLLIVNHYDGTRRQLSLLADLAQPHGMPDDHLTFKSTNEEGSATVTRYKLPTLDLEQNKSFPGLIGNSALADDWVAVSLKASQPSSSYMIAERVCLLDFSFNNELHYSDELSSAGGIGLSPDGRFLAVSGKKGGIKLLERSGDRLVQLAEAGAAPLGNPVVVGTRNTTPGLAPEIDVVFGETPFDTDGQPSSLRQSVVAYTYSPQTQKMRNSFAARTESAVTSLAIMNVGGDREMIAAGLANGSARIWLKSTGKPIVPALHHVGEGLLVAFPASSGEINQPVLPFLTVSAGGEISLWNCRNNALGEPLRSTDLSMQQPIVVSAPSSDARVWQSPDEQWIFEVSEAVAEGNLLLRRNAEQTELISIEVGFDAEEVFWTSDSRYALVIAGRVQAETGEANPLYKHPLSTTDSKAGLPSASHLAVFDMQSQKLIGAPLRFDGPMVDLQVPSELPVCFVGFLSTATKKGAIRRLNLHDLSHNDLDLPVPEFCCFSVSSDFSKTVIADDTGRPLLLRAGQDAIRLPGQIGTLTGYTRVVILDSGSAALMEPANPTASPVMVDLSTFRPQIIDYRPVPGRQRQVFSIPARTEFLVSNGDAEIAVIDGKDGSVRKTVPLEAALLKAVFSSDGEKLALYLRGGSISIFDTVNWQPLARSLSWSVLATGHASEIPRPHQFEFSKHGNLLLSDSVPQRMRLTAMPDSRTTAQLLFQLTPRESVMLSPGDRPTDSETLQLEPEYPGDWYDAYSTAISLVERDPSAAIRILRKLSLHEIDVSWVARRLAFIQLQVALNANELREWREAIDFLTSEKVQLITLGPTDVGPILRELCFSSVAHAEIFHKKWQVTRPTAPEASNLSLIYDLADANVFSAMGRNKEAWESHGRLLNSTPLKELISKNKETIAYVFRAALAGLRHDRSAADLLPAFDAIAEDPSASIAVSRRYFCYLTGISTVADVDLQIADSSIDPRIPLFHRFIDELEKGNEYEKGLRLARDMVEASTDRFRLSPWLAGPKTLPVLRAHCRLFEADVLLRLKRRDEAREAVLAAMQDWDAYCQQLTNLGLDPRALWVERVGYELLMSRIGTQLSQDSKTP